VKLEMALFGRGQAKKETKVKQETRQSNKKAQTDLSCKERGILERLPLGRIFFLNEGRNL
jgi:hypothetical protein